MHCFPKIIRTFLNKKNIFPSEDVWHIYGHILKYKRMTQAWLLKLFESNSFLFYYTRITFWGRVRSDCCLNNLYWSIVPGNLVQNANIDSFFLKDLLSLEKNYKTIWFHCFWIRVLANLMHLSRKWIQEGIRKLLGLKYTRKMIKLCQK